VIEINETAVLLTILGLLMIVSVLSSRGFERLGVPVVLLFLMVGMLAGSEGIGGLAFNDYRLAFRIGTGALILILLDGGLNTPMAAVKESIKPAGILATVGVALTAGLLAVCSHLLGLSWEESLLLGAVVSSTDAAAVFAVLRGGNLHLIRRVGTTLELESGINDPMAVILTMAVISVLTGQSVSWMELILGVPLQLLIGLVVGVGAGYAARGLLRRIRLATAGFYPVLTLALAFVAFGVATLANGSGYLAVYAAATVLGNSPIPYRNGLVRVHDAIAWLSQISMFGMFGLLVYPSQLWPIAGVGIGIALLLAFVVRPVAVTLCLLPFRFPAREVAYMGWVGLKGAVPIILATFPVLAGVEEGMKVFNLVFFVVVFSSIIPGATLRPVTRWLGMQVPETPTPLAALEINSTRMLNGELLSFFITDELAVCGATISQVPFPPTSSAVLLVRGEELIAIRGNTVLQPGDHVYVFCRSEDKPFILFLFGRPQEHG
jgi:cell volume regulation protein A